MKTERIKEIQAETAYTRTLNIYRVAELIKSMPTGQAIQIMKSEITGQPETSVIDGDLVVSIK